MIFHLDLEPGLENLLGQLTQQAVRANQVDPVGSGLLDGLLSNRRINRARGCAVVALEVPVVESHI